MGILVGVKLIDGMKDGVGVNLAGKAHITRSHVFPTRAHLWKAINHSGHVTAYSLRILLFFE